LESTRRAHAHTLHQFVHPKLNKLRGMHSLPLEPQRGAFHALLSHGDGAEPLTSAALGEGRRHDQQTRCLELASITSHPMIFVVVLALLAASLPHVRAQDDQQVVETYVRTHGPETFRQPAGYLQFPYIVRGCGCARGFQTVPQVWLIRITLRFLLGPMISCGTGTAVRRGRFRVVCRCRSTAIHHALCSI
jgi:hypothetical protein